MKFLFSPAQGLIVIRDELAGPAASGVLRLALDTGATSTLINAAMLVALGYDPVASSSRTELTTGSGVEYAPRVVVKQVRALGHTRRRLSVLAHTLPPSARVDGLLGLDFLRGKRLAIDFRAGSIEID